jgi:hypothetical protein
MKKVRMLGLAGFVPAAMILTVPATPAVARSTPNAAKTVSHVHAVSPLINCGNLHHKSEVSASKPFRTLIEYSGVCVWGQVAKLFKRQTGLTERTRFYSGGGTLERTTWQAGNESGSQTIFSSLPNMNAREVCQALVLNAHHSIVKYGPLCEKI